MWDTVAVSAVVAVVLGFRHLMTKFFIALILVAALLVSGLVGLLRGRRQPMGSPEALERAKARNRELEAQEQREDER